jgi:hypothetical protein
MRVPELGKGGDLSMSDIAEAIQDLGAKPYGEAGKSIYRTDLSRVPAFARPAILAHIAREEGTAMEDIVVEGVA